MSKQSLAGQFGGLPMKALIGAPLKAATDANAMISRAQTQFLLNTCFEKIAEDSDDLRPIMVKFTVERQMLDEAGKPLPEKLAMDFAVPLMTLIPINSLAIESMEISFEMEVKSSREFRRESQQDIAKRTDEQQSERSYDSHKFDTELHGTISHRGTEKGTEKSGANYHINLTAGQLPLPKGITAMLDIFSKNLMPIPSKATNSQTEPTALNNPQSDSKKPNKE